MIINTDPFSSFFLSEGKLILKIKMKQIDYKEAISFLLPRHYSGRKPSISYAFGYYENEKQDE